MDFQKFNPYKHNSLEVARLVANSTDYHNLPATSPKNLIDNLSDKITQNNLNFDHIYILTENTKYLGIIIFSYYKKSNSLFSLLKLLATLKITEFSEKLYMFLVKDNMNMTPQDIYLDLIYIEPEYRNKGIGTLSISYLIELTKKERKKQILLHVDSANSAARSFYEKLGFKYMFNDDSVLGKSYLAMNYSLG
ncbi:MAG: GNAT family N-acetyltransferase [Candidatus Dadabacteria bacterium]|nr:GNAT family N-acetyltransferase [Candidatus Dadabacteria bacterium]NIS10199.1 GNAT family N-acetyltransferase [Candidatus Dadabacteria bacterium]NIV42634.1 GNAT family N-acetyltransferase [Candidatus Dadabacteria bacterium]NIX16565.1 GNAT family N-acetyltransferase [Candidatus Dadabacteria bacterium]NIY23114.1 GNAT family N-acetyltransferase [Candidatus Dadabacteria bacterium]